MGTNLAAIHTGASNEAGGEDDGHTSDSDAIDDGSSDDEPRHTDGLPNAPPVHFHIGGRKRHADGVASELEPVVCKGPGCDKTLRQHDGHDGWCLTCMVTMSSHALPVDLLALMRVPGTLHGAQGMSSSFYCSMLRIV